MPITTSELVDLISHSKCGAVSGEEARLEILIETIHDANIRAEICSAESVFLQRVVEAHRQFLTDGAITMLDQVEIYGVDLAVIDAIPRSAAGRRQIVVFSGLLHIVFFYAALINVVTYLKVDQPDYRVSINDTEHAGALQFSTAGMVLIADYIETGRSLIDITTMLTDQVRANVINGYVGAILFIILHELGHIELGHLNDAAVHSERMRADLAYDQEINQYQQNEFDADLFAINCIKEEYREILTPSIAFFLGSFMFLESFMKENWTHPYSVNRLDRVVGAARMPPEAKSIMDALIHDRVAGLHRHARQKTTRARAFDGMFEKMPASVAHGVVKFIMSDVDKYQSKLGLNYISTYSKST